MWRSGTGRSHRTSASAKPRASTTSSSRSGWTGGGAPGRARSRRRRRPARGGSTPTRRAGHRSQRDEGTVEQPEQCRGGQPVDEVERGDGRHRVGAELGQVIHGRAVAPRGSPPGALHGPLSLVPTPLTSMPCSARPSSHCPGRSQVDHHAAPGSVLGGRGHVLEERLHLCLQSLAPTDRAGEVLGEQLAAAAELVGRAGEGDASDPCPRPAPGPPSVRCPGGPAGPARPLGTPGARCAPAGRPAPRWAARRVTVDPRSSRVISAAASVACTRAVAPSTIRSARCTLRDSWSSAVASSLRATEMPWLNGTWWDVTGRSAIITAR